MITNVIRTCFPAAAKVVAEKAEEINKLNVFPVPDGDTGTNMSLTLNTVVAEVEALPKDATMEQIAAAITHGSLMGARGNSGVITSQILRGIAEGLVGARPSGATPSDVAAALRNGVKVAFKAVRKPVEGTILTVLRDVSARADQLEKTKITTPEMLDALVIEAYESVARTPELLPVLKENGVVDSGAYGLATLIEAFVNAYEGKAGEVSDFKTTIDSDDAKAQVANVVDIEINDDWTGSEYRYCTEFLFHADSKNFDEDANLRYLSSMGDCELLVGANPDYKIHVTPTVPTAFCVTCSIAARSSTSLCTTWTSRRRSAPRASAPTSRPMLPRVRIRRSALWPSPLARVRQTSCVRLASMSSSRAARP